MLKLIVWKVNTVLKTIMIYKVILITDLLDYFLINQEDIIYLKVEAVGNYTFIIERD